MKAPSPPYAVEPCCQTEFEQALIEALKRRFLSTLLVTEYESRFVPGFRDLVRNNDWSENRIVPL
jgi:hypothetical protein